MKVSLSVGNYGAVPYCLEGLGLRVYCVEELCYCLKENAYLLDVDLMSDRLVAWLDQECGLKSLAEELYRMVHHKGSLSAFVIRILDYVGFYDQEILQEVERTLKKGAGLNVLEKRKLRVDQLLELRKYGTALAEYDGILEAWEESAWGGAELKSAIWHNKGVAYAGLMRYDRAAEAFYTAYETDGKEESLKCFLAAKRMELKSQDYVSFAAEHPEYQELALELEKEVEGLNLGWERTADERRLSARSVFRQEDERGYQDENEHMLQAMKAGYRSMAG